MLAMGILEETPEYCTELDRMRHLCNQYAPFESRNVLANAVVGALNHYGPLLTVKSVVVGFFWGRTVTKMVRFLSSF
jgi:hypothetical protein